MIVNGMDINIFAPDESKLLLELITIEQSKMVALNDADKVSDKVKLLDEIKRKVKGFSVKV